ncbi:MAG TPA: DNA polymerase III subunit delta [Steroidobacteraceae bacterium]|nr:DNA polymerase III subunit delta [Steroidobacteraceae bacterium]
MRLTPDQLPGALKSGLRPVYLVSGDEPLTVGECADAIRSAGRTGGYADRTVFFIERGFSWDELRHSTQALSLFAERRLFELRMPSGKPDKGAQVLLDIATAPPPDVITLIVTGKLDRKSSEAPWVRAIENHGAWIAVWPVPADSLPAWLERRAAALGLTMDRAAARLIIDRVEGNLLAAKQELEILALLTEGGAISESLVMRTVADSARYDVFQLAEAAAAGDAARALKILTGLRGEGAEPTLILWALVRELRGLWQARVRDRAGAHGAGSYAPSWNQAAKPSPKAQRRMGKMPLASLFREAARTDRIIKGILPGDAWSSIVSLTMAIAGALQANQDSGRVANV